MSYQIFDSELSNGFVELYFEIPYVQISRYFIDAYDHATIVDFCHIIKKAFDTSIEIGCKYHEQTINNDDMFKIINNDEWTVISKKDDHCVIQCDIYDASRLVIESFIGHKLSDDE